MGRPSNDREQNQNRKVQDRLEKEAIRKQKNKDEWGMNDQDLERFSRQLSALGLVLKDVKGDGNCLFRALGDQLNGDGDNHLEYRERTVRYISSHRDEFEPFLSEEDGKNFDDAVQKLSQPKTYAGHWALIAFSREFNVNITIHQLDQSCWKILCDHFSPRELHIAYFGYEHYSSIRNSDGPHAGPSNIQIRSSPESLKNGSSSGSNSSKQSNHQGIDWYEQQVIDATGCHDLQLIRSLLDANGYDADAVIGVLMDEKEAYEAEMKLFEEAMRNSSINNSIDLEKENKNQKPQNNKEKDKEKAKEQRTRNLSNKERKDLAKKEKKEKRILEKQEDAKKKGEDTSPLPDLSRQILI